MIPVRGAGSLQFHLPRYDCVTNCVLDKPISVLKIYLVNVGWYYAAVKDTARDPAVVDDEKRETACVSKCSLDVIPLRRQGEMLCQWLTLESSGGRKNLRVAEDDNSAALVHEANDLVHRCLYSRIRHSNRSWIQAMTCQKLDEVVEATLEIGCKRIGPADEHIDRRSFHARRFSSRFLETALVMPILRERFKRFKLVHRGTGLRPGYSGRVGNQRIVRWVDCRRSSM